MEKIKNIFRPGHEQDDNVMYGTPEPKNTHALGGSHDHEDVLAANPGVDKSDQGDLRAEPDRSEPTTQFTSTTQPTSGSQSGHGTQTDSLVQREQTDTGLAGSSQEHDQPGGLTGTTGGVTGQIFNPHGSKYDESRFPSGTSAADPETQASFTQQLANEQLRTDPGVEKRNHGILRQILNPHGEKYDEIGYGQTASVGGPSSTAAAAGAPGTGLERLDSDNSSTTAIKGGKTGPYARDADQTVSGSSTTGDNHHLGRDAAIGTAGAAGLGAAGYETNKHYNDPSLVISQMQTTGPTSTTTTNNAGHERHFPLGGGGTSPSTGPASSSVAGTQQLPDRTAQGATRDDNDLGRDVAIGGTAVAGAAGAGLYAGQHNSDPYRNTGAQVQPSSTYGSTTGTTTQQPATFAYGSTTAPGHPGVSSTTGDDSHLGRDATIAGGLAGAGAGAESLAQEHRTHGPHGTDDINAGQSSNNLGERTRDPAIDNATYTARSFHLPGDSSGFHQDQEKPHEGYIHHTHGPHASDIANRLDPHVPGEFPTESGTDRHFGRDAATGGAGLGAAGMGAYELSPRDQPSTTAGLPAGQATGHGGVGSYEMAQGADSRLHPVGEQQTLGPSSAVPQSQHQYGRDAAVAGGVDAAGVGAYELGKDHHDSASQATGALGTQQPGSTTGAATTGTLGGQQPSSSTGAYGLPDNRAHDPSYVPLSGSQTQSTPATAAIASTQQPGQEHNYGRDAALAGGAGAAGVGAYELGKDRDGRAQGSAQRDPMRTTTDTTTTTTTSGGQSSGTTDPHSSGPANKVDPRVQPDSSRLDDQRATQPEQTSHVGHETAIAGGAGAAGVVAYETEKHHHGDGHNKLHKKEDPRGWTQEQKHEHELQQARQQEAAKHGDHGEKKESLIHRILHPAQHKQEKEAATQHRGRDPEASTATGATAAGGPAVGEPEYGSGSQVAGQVPYQLDAEGRAIDPHTGLPMDVAKYGDGSGVN